MVFFFDPEHLIYCYKQELVMNLIEILMIIFVRMMMIDDNVIIVLITRGC